MSIPLKELPTRKLLARMGLRLFIILTAFFFLTVVVGPLFHFTAPFIIAYIVTAIILMPIIKRLSKKLRKFWSIVMVVAMLAVVGLVVGILVYYLIAQAISMAKNWEHYKEMFETLFQTISNFLGKNTRFESAKVYEFLEKLGDNIVGWVKHDLPGMTPQLIDKVRTVVPGVGSFLLSFLFFIIATYFTCVDFDSINRGIRKYVPNAIRPQLRQVKNSSITLTFAYLKAQVIISSMVAGIAFIVMLIVGQKYAFFWAIAVGVIDFIPMLGSGLVLAPWVVLLVITGDFKKAIIYGILTFCLFMFRRIIEPKIVGEQTGLHPLLTLLSLFVGIKLGGIFGMIVAPILCMILVDLIKAGFFLPTVHDIKEIFYRMGRYADMNVDGEEFEEKD